MSRQIRNLGSIIVDELRFEFVRNALMTIGRGKRLLDLGCGIKPFKHLYEQQVDYSVGIDTPFSPHDEESINALALGHALPFKDGAFDIVLCTEVLEHVPDPAAVLHEIRRVLSRNGHLILTTPFLVPLHEGPYDYYRYTMYGLKYLCEQQDLQVEKLQPFSGLTGVTISFLVQAQLKFWYFFWKATKFPGLYTIYNPIIFLLIFLPQRAYLSFLRLVSRIPALKTVHEKLTYTTKGYGLVALKK